MFCIACRIDFICCNNYEAGLIAIVQAHQESKDQLLFEANTPGFSAHHAHVFIAIAIVNGNDAEVFLMLFHSEYQLGAGIVVACDPLAQATNINALSVTGVILGGLACHEFVPVALVAVTSIGVV